MSAPVDPRLKQLRIKTGVVKRITKEKEMYAREAAQLNAKVEKMKADGEDQHDIKKQTEVYEESRAMIPDAKRRMQTAIHDLQNFLDKENDLKESEELKAAKETLEYAANQLEN